METKTSSILVLLVLKVQAAAFKRLFKVLCRFFYSENYLMMAEIPVQLCSGGGGGHSVRGTQLLLAV